MKLTAITLAALAFASPAIAAPDCMPIPALLEEYRSEYDERAAWVGISGKDGGDLLILTAPDGSWSIFRTNGDIGCLVDFGLTNRTFPQGDLS